MTAPRAAGGNDDHGSPGSKDDDDHGSQGGKDNDDHGSQGSRDDDHHHGSTAARADTTDQRPLLLTP